MTSDNNSNSSDKKSKINIWVEEIAETLLSLVSKEDNINLDSVENALTPIFKVIRKRTILWESR